MSTIKTTNITHGSNSGTANLVLGSDGSVTFASGAATGTEKGRNLIINGGMTVAQRGTSATAEGYQTVDRFLYDAGGEDETITQAQVDVASGTTPYTLGFRKAWKLTNGNQTGGAGASDYVQPQYKFEAQDIATSGWDYTSASSKITLSFWVKSSVAGDYTLNFETKDGTAYRYLMEYTLSADTWTKVTKTIPGNSNLTFNNDTGHGATIMLYPFLGSTYVQADQENNWYASSNNKFGTTSTTSWWTTNDATWEITGVQLEVGEAATAFEHKTYADELRGCYRYYYRINPATAGEIIADSAWTPFGNKAETVTVFPVDMRAAPTAIEQSGTASDYYILSGSSSETCSAVPVFTKASPRAAKTTFEVSGGPWNAGHACLPSNKTTDGFLAWSAEL